MANQNPPAKFDIHWLELLGSLAGIGIASGIIALFSHGTPLARYFLNLTFPVVIIVELYRFFGLDKKFWQGFFGFLAYMVFRAFVVKFIFRGELDSLLELLRMWYFDQPVSFLPQHMLVCLFDIGFILIALAFLAGWIPEKSRWGKDAIIWTATILLAGTVVAVVLQWLFPATSSDIGSSFMDPAKRDAFAQRILTAFQNPVYLVGLLSAIAVFIYCFKTKKWNAIFGVLFLIAIIGGAIFAANAVTGHLRTGRWPWETYQNRSGLTSAPELAIPLPQTESGTACFIVDPDLIVYTDKKAEKSGFLQMWTSGNFFVEGYGEVGPEGIEDEDIPKNQRLVPNYPAYCVLFRTHGGSWKKLGEGFKGFVDRKEIQIATNIKSEFNRTETEKGGITVIMK